MSVSVREPVRVLITNKVSPIAEELLEKSGNYSVTQNDKLTTQEMISEINDKGCEALVIRSHTLDADFINSVPTLKLIVRAGTGFDNINLEAAAKNSILVVNTPNGNVASTASLTVAHIGSLARGIPFTHMKMHEGIWDKDSAKKHIVLDDKTLGIIGCGRIGFDVAKRLPQMNIIAYDPYIAFKKKAERRIRGIEFVQSKDELFKRADVVTLHASLLHPDLAKRPDMQHIESARDVINAENIDKCKDGVFIVNCARGAMVDPHALREALDSGKVAGAALDVQKKESSSDDPHGWARDNPLVGARNIILTPHIGGTTVESLYACAVESVSELNRYFIDRKTSENAVNLMLLWEYNGHLSKKHKGIRALCPPRIPVFGRLATATLRI